MPPEVTVFSNQPGRRHKHHQRKNLESMGERERHVRRKPLPAIHFSGDTSRYVYGQHENYNGILILFFVDHCNIDVSLCGWAGLVIYKRNFVFVLEPKTKQNSISSKTIELIHTRFKRIG